MTMTSRGTILKALPWLLASYVAASFIHFAHNAEFLADYPNLPAWLSRAGVYGAWFAQLAIGVLGYALYRRGRELSGLLVIAAFAMFGFDGLLHYTRAPLADHTVAMNTTIWTEVIAAALLFLAAMTLVAEYLSRAADDARSA